MAHPVPGTRPLKVFDAAVRHLNFTRAADEVGLTPAAVSHQIKELEEQLGLVLFHRTSRTIRLTEAGAVLHHATAEALALVDGAVLRARRLSRGVAQLKLTMDPVFTTKWMLPRIDQFRKLKPEIDLRFDISFELRDFERDDVDMGVRFGTGRYPGLRAERLFDNLVIPVCSPGLLRSGPPLREPRDLMQHTLAHIEWTGGGVTWPNWRMWMAAAGVSDFDGDRVLLFDDSAHAIQAAIDGSVVALADFAMVANDLSTGRLVRPFEHGIKLPQEYGYFLVYPEASAGDTRIAALQAWMQEEAGKAPVADR